MDDVDSGLSDFIYSVLPNSSSNDLLLEALQTLGVETVEDLNMSRRQILLIPSGQLKLEN